MSNAQLIHIFDNSTCLTKKQMKDYVSGIMTNEEAHAVEVHLNSCPLCNDAVEGLFEDAEGGLATMGHLNADFLKDKFGLSDPQVHLNSVAAATPASRNPNIHVHKKKDNTRPMWRVTSIAAALLMLVALIWYYRISHQSPETSAMVAQQMSAEQPQVISQPGHQPEGPIAMNESKKKDVSAADVTPSGTAKALTDATAQVGTQSMQMAPAAPAQTEQKARQLEPLDVVAYKVPLIGEDERKVITSDEIEKMPTRSTADIAATNAGANPKSFGNSYKKDDVAANVAGARSEGSAYVVDGVKTTSAKEKSARAGIAKAESVQVDKLEQADKLYNRKNYADALNVYNKEMQNSDYDRKAQATLGAARCYIALGNTAKAKQLLQPIADQGSGASKRQAKRLLREME